MEPADNVCNSRLTATEESDAEPRITQRGFTSFSRNQRGRRIAKSWYGMGQRKAQREPRKPRKDTEKTAARWSAIHGFSVAHLGLILSATLFRAFPCLPWFLSFGLGISTSSRICEPGEETKRLSYGNSRKWKRCNKSPTRTAFVEQTEILGRSLFTTFRAIHVSLLVGLRKFFCFKVAFIAPREESRARVRSRLLNTGPLAIGSLHAER